MLTQQFDWETEQYLSELLVREQTTTNELLKTLIRDRWLSTQEQPFPESLDQEVSPAELPKPKTQKQRIAEYVRKKYLR